jgi:hypothetical protein
MQLNIGVYDAVTVTDVVTVLVSSPRDGWIVNLRSSEQGGPLGMDTSDFSMMRSDEQTNPRAMDTTDIL